MPTYEYECKKCSHRFEVFQAMSDEPLKKCKKCGKEVRRLIFGGAGVIFKGSGFYVTDRQGACAKSETCPKADTCPAKNNNTKNPPVKTKAKPAAETA